ncbi:MAG: hypothetical protein ACYC2O_00460 [Microthrixaceae bacterium]
MTPSAACPPGDRRAGGSGRHAVRVGALVVSLSMAMTCLAWAAAASPAAAQGCGPAPSGQVAVALVVDDSTSAPSERCVVVGGRATGYDVLIAAGHTLRIEMGFLCAIDGVPATGCGNRPDFNGAYWRYFHAAPGGSWSYSSVGGGGYRMPDRCAVEGWRFASSASEAVAPRPAPPAVTCEAPPATTTPPPPAAPAPTAAPPVAGSGGAVAGGAPGAGTPPGSPAPGGAVPAPTSVPGEVATTVPASPGTTPEGATTVPPAGSSSEDAAASGQDTEREEHSAATRAARRADRGGGSSAVGLVVASLVVAGLGAGAWWRSRSRHRGEESVAGP